MIFLPAFSHCFFWTGLWTARHERDVGLTIATLWEPTALAARKPFTV